MKIKRIAKLSIKFLLVLILIAGAIGSALAAVWTVIPDASASKESMLGYKSHCSFAPISTLILTILAILFSYILFRTKILKIFR